jgi:putative hydrolase of the HAD superfamily
MSLPAVAELDALLLDLDDTILDDRTSIDHCWGAVKDLLRERDPSLADPDLTATIGEVTGWFWSDPDREREGRLDLFAARRNILARVLDQMGRPDPALAEDASHHYGELREQTCRLADGALDALGRLRAAVPRLALVTNGAAVPQRAKIDRFELAGYFDHIQVEGEFGLGKPERAVYLHVAGRVDASPERCLMVGDNFRADVLGALDAGMHAAWIDIAGDGRAPHPAPRPHVTVESLVELADRLLQPAQAR